MPRDLGQRTRPYRVPQRIWNHLVRFRTYIFLWSQCGNVWCDWKPPMPRYFLHFKEGPDHFKEGPDVIIDPEGQEFADLSAAHHEAAEVARDLMAERLRSGQPLGLGHEVIIANEYGDALATVVFQAALPEEDP